MLDWLIPMDTAVLVLAVLPIDDKRSDGLGGAMFPHYIDCVPVAEFGGAILGREAQFPITSKGVFVFFLGNELDALLDRVMPFRNTI